MRFAVLVRRNQFVKGVDEQSPIVPGGKPLTVCILRSVSISIGCSAVFHLRNYDQRVSGYAYGSSIRNMDRCGGIHPETKKLKQAIYTVEHTFPRAACNN